MSSMSSQPNADADAAQVPDVPGVVVLCGSERDMAHAREIAEAAREFGLGAVIRIASAHRTPEKALQIIRDLNTAARRVPVVLITVAGRSNALSGFCDPQTVLPVIACPPPSDFADDVWSSLRMPTGVAPLYVCNPTNAAVAAAKIIGLSTPAVAQKVAEYQQAARQTLEEADARARSDARASDGGESKRQRTAK